MPTGEAPRFKTIKELKEAIPMDENNYLSEPIDEGNIFVDNYYLYRKYENTFVKELDEAGVVE